MTKTNVPRLRFSEFSGEWKGKSLKNLGFVYGGLTGKSKDDFGKGNSNYITYMTINRKFVSEEKDTNNVMIHSTEKQNKVKKGDVLFTISSETPEEVGLSSTWLGNSEVYLNSFSFGYRFNEETNGYFTSSLFRSIKFRKKIFPLAQGISRYNLSKSNFLNLNISMPIIFEQQKIGDFFAKQDKLIELQTQKVDQLKKLKRGYLQKMFPQEGETVPRLRFSGFSGEWKEEKLDSLLSECSNREVKNVENHKLLKVSLHFKGVKTTTDHPRVTSKGRKYFLRKPGDLIIGKQNFHNGGFAIIPDNVEGYVASSAIVSFTNKSNCNLNFVNFYMMNNDWLRRTTIFIGGTGQKEYSVKTLKSLKIKIPTLEEQEKISKFFKVIDNKIEYEKGKLNRLNKLKKAYLQKMFV